MLHCGEHVLLTCNFWVEAGLVNVVLGYIEHIFYAPSLKSPQLRQFTIVLFKM